MTDADLAARIGRTAGAVRTRRIKAGVSAFRDRRRAAEGRGNAPDDGFVRWTLTD
jgi:hypothetical protein